MIVISELERALWALASSSGGAACPGGRGVGVRSQPRGWVVDPKVISAKKICDARKDEQNMDGQT